jgi:hypothetical protein
MNLEQPTTENLFSYGTLQSDAVQLSTFGRRLKGKPDVLVGYKLAMVQIRDHDFAAANGSTQRSVKFTGNETDLVAGTLLLVTSQELEKADSYEPTDYERILATLRSGEKAWLYLQKTDS